jgi:hypothetical protein
LSTRAYDGYRLANILEFSGDQFSSVQSESLFEQFGDMPNNPVLPTLTAGSTEFASIDDFRVRIRPSTTQATEDSGDSSSPAIAA